MERVSGQSGYLQRPCLKRRCGRGHWICITLQGCLKRTRSLGRAQIRVSEVTWEFQGPPKCPSNMLYMLYHGIVGQKINKEGIPRLWEQPNLMTTVILVHVMLMYKLFKTSNMMLQVIWVLLLPDLFLHILMSGWTLIQGHIGVGACLWRSKDAVKCLSPKFSTSSGVSEWTWS